MSGQFAPATAPGSTLSLGTTHGRGAWVRNPPRTPSDVRYIALWSVFAAVALVVVGFEVVALARFGGAQKPLGWTAESVSGVWSITSVSPDGPADGLVEVGDVLLAIDGDRNAARLGPRWYLRDSPGRSEYQLTVGRGGSERSIVVPWILERNAEETIWRWLHLLTGLVYLGIGLMVAFLRPGTKVARMAVTVTMGSAAFFITIVLDTPVGIVAGGVPLGLALAFYFVQPLHLVAGYRFVAAFPLGDRSTPGWRRFERVFYTAGFLLWPLSVYVGVVRSLGPQRATEIAAAQFPLSILHDGPFQALIFAFSGAAGVANALVCWRNYRSLPPGDLQRRLRWVSIGIAAGLLPIVVVTPLLILSADSIHSGGLVRTLHVVNLAVIVIPISMGYAVVKHRVYGIRVALRLGLQYLLARNVLRMAVAAPVVLVALSLVRNPDLTLLELISGPQGRMNLVLVILAGIVLRYRTSLMTRIDRRFFREAYRRDEIFSALAAAISRVKDIPELARLLSSQIQAALHPGLVLALATRGGGADLDVVYSSDGKGDPASFRDIGVPPEELRDFESAGVVGDAPSLSGASREALEGMGVEVLVPISGPNTGVIGVLLLGGKLSEEPYTGEDMKLLEETAAQTGIVWENLALQKALSREQSVRRQLAARLDDGSSAFMLECPMCGLCFDSDAGACPIDGHDLVASLPIPRVLDAKYRIERLLGRGGMGAVYEATDLRLARSVAIKVIEGERFTDPVARQRFAREARASARVVHANVVGVFDLGDFEGGAYIVLEYLRGRTLHDVLKTEVTLRPFEARRLLAGILDGVEAAHAKGVIHRDLKPDNILLVEPPEGGPSIVKVLDFGIAVARDLEFRDWERLTRTGTVIGTLAYMSPEQFAGDPVDERSDLFSLGIIALEMLTGPIGLRGPVFTRIGGVLTERLLGPGSSPAERELGDALGGALRERHQDRHANVSAFRSAVLPAIERLER